MRKPSSPRCARRRQKMPTDATFLLAAIIIVATAIGFAFKVYSDRDRDPPPRISADYIRGLNLVLSRKTDEALELFVQMAKVDDETLETHFALGHLFRRRGEVERAIRVHQNLLARPNLNETQRHQAIFSLAEDYLGAGLYDRAEQLFAELDDSPTLAEASLEKLVYIYEREREWQKAIDAHRKLEMLSGTKSNQVAHYYCELAEAARARGDRELARSYLKNTIRSETGQLRGGLIRAGLAQEEREITQAIALYEQVIEKDRTFITEVLPPLVDCYRTIDKLPYLDAKIENWVGRGSDLTPRFRVRRDHRQSHELRRAQCVRRKLRARQPGAREPRERRRAEVPARGGAAPSDRADRSGTAPDRGHERALSMHELRLQHAAIHLALPELQALGDRAADPELAARELAGLALPAS